MWRELRSWLKSVRISYRKGLNVWQKHPVSIQVAKSYPQAEYKMPNPSGSTDCFINIHVVD